MGYNCGLIGLPNVGKSTLFNLLTKLNVPAKNFPFCTIKPNTGIVSVPDHRLEILKKIIKPKKTIPSTIQIVDIAGLVQGASKGEGLGNQFLSKIRETDAIFHVLRCFKKKEIIHIHSNVDPLNDLEIVEMELIFSDLHLCEKILSQKKYTGDLTKKKILVLKKTLEICLNHLQKNKMLNTLIFNAEEINLILRYKFLTLKPVIYIANTNYKKEEENNLNRLVSIAKKTNRKIIQLSIKNKNESTFSPINEKKIKEIISSGYSALQLKTFFTVGKKEVRSWTIPSNSSAPEAAKKIHSDLKKGFIRAKVISFNDFVYFKGEEKSKKNGKLRMEGKDYIVQDGDIIHFLFNS